MINGITTVYYIVLLLVLCASYYCFKQAFTVKRSVRFKSNRYRELSNFVKAKLNDDTYAFPGTGINLSMSMLHMIRLTCTLLVVLYLGYSVNDPIIIIVSAAVLLAVTTTRLSFAGIETPYSYIVKYLKSNYKSKIDIELFNAITQLKNLAVSSVDKPLGTDYIIQTLSNFAKITKPMFSRYLQPYRLGKSEDAYNYFVEATGTKLGGQFADILLKLDNLAPKELTTQLELYQHNVSQERITEMQRKYERLSNLFFIPSIVLALIVLLNFVIIVVYIDLFGNLNF